MGWRHALPVDQCLKLSAILTYSDDALIAFALALGDDIPRLGQELPAIWPWDRSSWIAPSF